MRKGSEEVFHKSGVGSEAVGRARVSGGGGRRPCQVGFNTYVTAIGLPKYLTSYKQMCNNNIIYQKIM